jgi:hypothetical protein
MITLEDLDPSDNVNIENIYGIVYRIFSKTENKSYIGQTMSHQLLKDKWYPYGINKRIQKHLDITNVENKNTKLTEVFKKHPRSDFEIFIEEKIPSNQINKLNNVEADYIKKYDSIVNGYNFVKKSTSISKSKQKIIDFYNLQIDEEKYVDDTRQRRSKDITTGKKFKCNSERLEFFKDKKVEKVIITYSANALRLLVQIENMKDKYRLIMGNKKEEVLELAYQLTKNVEIKGIAQDFFLDKDTNETYKLQDRIEEIKNIDNVTSVKGKFYYHKRFNGHTYTLFFYGNKKNRVVIKNKISFGGKHDTIESIYNDAKIFLQKLSEVKNIDNINLQEPKDLQSPLNL